MKWVYLSATLICEFQLDGIVTVHLISAERGFTGHMRVESSQDFEFSCRAVNVEGTDTNNLQIRLEVSNPKILFLPCL